MAAFPNLLGDLLDAKEEPVPETKNRKLNPGTPAPDLPAIAALVAGLMLPGLPAKDATVGEPRPLCERPVADGVFVAQTMDAQTLPDQLTSAGGEGPLPELAPEFVRLPSEALASNGLEAPPPAGLPHPAKAAETQAPPAAKSGTEQPGDPPPVAVRPMPTKPAPAPQPALAAETQVPPAVISRAEQPGDPPPITVRLMPTKPAPAPQPALVVNAMAPALSDSPKTPEDDASTQAGPVRLFSPAPDSRAFAPLPAPRTEAVAVAAEPAGVVVRALPAIRPAIEDSPIGEPSVGTPSLAFAARLIPIDKEPPVPGLPGQPAQATPAPDRAETETRPDPGAAPGKVRALARATPMAPTDPEQKRPESVPPARIAPYAESALMDSLPRDAPQSAPVHGTEPDGMRLDRGPAPGEPHRVPPALPPEVPQSVSPARDIRLQVSGEQRVDVRLTERAGEIQVAVRTPDTRLAGALRDELPALSARLELSGFRAETWHPDPPRPETFLRSSQPHASLSEDRQTGQRGGRHHEESPPRQPAQPPKARDSSPKEFSWLLSSFN
jgi:hypothetical protein